MYQSVLKITGGHRSISDQFAHKTMQLALEPVIWSNHSGGEGGGAGVTVVLQGGLASGDFSHLADGENT